MRIRKALGKPIALTLLIALVVGVMIGIGFGKQGLQFFSDRFAPGSGNARQALSGQLSVLALKGVFSKTFLTEFKTRTGVEIVLTEASEPEALWAQFESPGKRYELRCHNFNVLPSAGCGSTRPIAGP